MVTFRHRRNAILEANESKRFQPLSCSYVWDSPQLLCPCTASLGLTPSSWPGKPRIGTVGLEVMGRRSNEPRSSVVTWVELDSERYFVSMLGERTDWVRNVRAAQGHAVIRHRSREEALLEEVPIYERAPLLRAYLKRTAVATRHHLGIDPAAPLAEFERIAPAHPLFHIVSPISKREE